jgi:hypothetical protein
MTVAEQFPAYPQPANVQPSRPESEPEPELAVSRDATESSAARPDAIPEGPWDIIPNGASLPEAAPMTASTFSPPASPPAWHPDPSGRFHFRWWDGSQWTSQVSIDGHHLIDTNPDQRIGPY